MTVTCDSRRALQVEAGSTRMTDMPQESCELMASSQPGGSGGGSGGGGGSWMGVEQQGVTIDGVLGVGRLTDRQ